LKIFKHTKASFILEEAFFIYNASEICKHPEGSESLDSGSTKLSI
jgi:hypothetical protein